MKSLDSFKGKRRLCRLFSLSTVLALILQLVPLGLPAPSQAVTSLVERAPYPANILAPIARQVTAPLDALAAPLTGPFPLAYAAPVSPTGYITITKSYSQTVYQDWESGNNRVRIDLPYRMNITNQTGGSPVAFSMRITPTLVAGVSINWDESGGSTGGSSIWGLFGGDGSQLLFLNGNSVVTGTSYVGQYHLYVLQPVPDRTVITDTRTFFLYEGDQYTETHTHTTTIRAPDFDLSESWISASGGVCPGQRLTYTVSMSNPGGVGTTQPFTVISLITTPLTIYTDTLSPDATLAGNIITWTITSEDLDAGGANWITRTLAVSVPATLSNGAYLTNTYTFTSPEVVPTQDGWFSSGVMVGIVAGFTPVSATIYTGQSVAFQNTSRGIGGLSYQWNFGDGSPITTTVNPSHVFTNTGTLLISYTVTLTVTGACSGVYTATGTVNVNPLPKVQFATSDFAVDENDGPATITATLDFVPAVTATVDYTSSNGTAMAGSDYTAVADTLTFAPGVSSITFTVPITDDLIDEPDETIWLQLSNPVSTSITGTNPVTLTIVDDDVPEVQFDSATYNVDESDPSVTITTTLNITSWQIISVTYATSDGTAVAGLDYITASGTLTFAPGVILRTFPVSITDDLLDESNETVMLTLSDESNAIITGTNPATLTILDDDNPPTVDFTSPLTSVSESGISVTIGVTLSAPSGLTVTVNYSTSNGTAVAGLDYVTATGTLTFTPGIMSQVFSVQVISDTLYEADETVVLMLLGAVDANATGSNNPATLTILDDDSPPSVQFSGAPYAAMESAGTAPVTVTLSAASGLTVTVAYTASDGTAVSPGDYTAITGTLTFTPGVASRVFGVDIVSDTLDEVSETVALALGNQSNATLGAPSNTTLTILDDDSPPSVQFSGAPYAAMESAGTAPVTVTLSAASGLTVTVAYTASDGTAVSPGDYTAITGTLTFTPGVASQVFGVDIVSDTLDEVSETVALALGNQSNATLGAPSNTTLTILDNDAPPDLSIDDASVAEGDAGTVDAVFTVTLSATSGQTVTVEHATANGTAVDPDDYTAISTNTLTFAPGETTHFITVTVAGDLLDEDDETFYVNLANAVNATIADGQGAGTIFDNDTASLSIADASVTEGNFISTDAVFTVTLSLTSTKQVTIEYATADGTAVSPGDYTTIPTTTLTFAPGERTQFITVTVQGDTQNEPNEIFYVNLANAVNATITDAQGEGTILDDDPPSTVNVELIPPTDAQSGAPGETVTYTLSLTNTGTVTESFYLTPTVAGEQWTTTVVPTLTVALPPSGTVPVTVSVFISPTALAGQQSIATITATSATSPTISDSSTLTTTAIIPCTPPVITGLTSDSPVDQGQTMHFTATVTGDTPITYTWDFGDFTSPASGVGLITTSHVYGSSGNFTVTLTVTNACDVNTDVVTVTVNCVPVSGGDFTWDPASPTTTQTVSFTGTVTGGSPLVNYAWNWGDGTPVGTGNPAFHTFIVSGTYTVLLTATNGCGWVTATHTITATGSTFTPTYGVELAPPTAAESGMPGELVIYTLALTNTGDVADSFDLTHVISGEQWTTVVVPTRTATLPPDGTTSVIVGVSISTTAVADQQSVVTVTATSVMTAVVSGSSVLTTTAIDSLRVYVPLVMRSYTPPGPPPLILVASPIALVAGETAVLTATALDHDGAPIAGLEVTFSTSDPLGSGALTTFVTTTNSSGQITAMLRSTLVGLVRVTAQGSNGASDATYLTFRSTSFCAPQLIAVAETGPGPRKVAMDTTGRRAFIAHDSSLTVMDLDTFAVITETQSVASGYGVAYDPDHNRIWVTQWDADRVVVLDGVTYAVLADLPAGDGPRDVAYNSANDRVYVINFGSETVDVYNATSLTFEQTLTDFKEPTHIAVNPNTNKIYVANHGLNSQLTVIYGDTHTTHRVYAQLFDGFAVTVDITRNLVYAASAAEARLAIIDGSTDLLLGTMDIQRSDGQKVTLRSIAVSPDVGPEGHLYLATSSEYGGLDQLLLIPNGWPTLGTPVPLDIARYPKEGLALDPDTNRFWVTSVTSGLVSVVQDGEPACSTMFSHGGDARYEFHVEMFAAPSGTLEVPSLAQYRPGTQSDGPAFTNCRFVR